MGIGLMGAAMAAMVVKACHVEPVVTAVPLAGNAAAPIAAPQPTPPALPVAPPAPEPAQAQGGAQLVFHNPCGQALLLAINFGTSSGQRVNAGFFELRPGIRMAPAAVGAAIAVNDRTLYYYTETLQTEPVETGGRHETVGDRVVGMKRLPLEPSERPAIDLECPGATSGRP